MIQEEQKFLLTAPDTGIIVATETAHLNLEIIKTEFGHNFNTLLIRNNNTVEISIILDGRKSAYIGGGGGTINLDWEDGIIYDDVQITNEDGAVNTVANKIRVSVGRTGDK